MKIVICGSSFFKEKMIECKEKLIKIGHEVIIHPDYESFVRGEKQEIWNKIQKEHYLAKKENDYIKWYYNAIVNSEGILVLNYDKKGIKNYIGGNTLMEIGFAHTRNKKIFLLNPIPEEISYADEIKAMYDVIINGDLLKIPLESEKSEESISLSQIARESEKIEQEIGLTFDDILNKLTQELGEFNDAVQKFRGRFCRKKEETNEHIKEELGDLILNIASICRKIEINPDELNLFAENTLNKFKQRKEVYKENLK